MSFQKTHCCTMMAHNVDAICDQHPNRFECPDMLVEYVGKFDSYGLIIHGSGSSMVKIDFCPWCGSKLRDLSSQFFDEIEALGLDLYDDLPKKYQTAEWWCRKELSC